jgi:hypothetical protein
LIPQLIISRSETFRALPKVVYYISGHGFGHAVRSIQVINELLDLGCEPIIKTGAPAFLFKEGLSRSVKIILETFDVGLYQLDNIRFDLAKTKERVKKILASADGMVQKEKQFLSDQRISGIICDIPFIPFAAAGQLRLPSVGVSNFSWDWIYGHYGKKDPDWRPLARAISGYYRQAGLLLRLPFFGTMDAFQKVEDIPLVARRSQRGKTEVRESLGLPHDRKIGLIGFSRLDLDKQAFKKIEKSCSDTLFLIMSPLNWRSLIFREIKREKTSFVDLIAAVDFVMTKPGYGIVSDCLSHGTPMIYSDRGEFPEYPILVEGIKSHLSHCYMPQEDLYSGNWEPYLARLVKNSRPRQPFKIDGARVAADRIVKWIAGRSPFA